MVRQNVRLKNYTTFRIGGKAAELCEAEDISTLKDLSSRNCKKIVLGRGSNVLVSDEGFDGLVIVVRASAFENVSGKFIVEAGMDLSKLSNIFIEDGLSGLEWACGIPGTVGGACIMNAGAFGGCIADVIESVDVLRDGKELRLKNRECDFTYRNSGFGANDIVLRATFCPVGSDRAKLLELKEQYALHRKATQPKGASAGSVFKRTNNNSAGHYIDIAGLKGLRCGGAQVSDKHANFIINTGTATAADVVALIASVKTQVKYKFDIELEEEIKYIGEFD